ncbi:hypothetical protein Poli38472_012580 [Pythium oligandrum]|uniref:Uncharacterized protein n=1 Tax=Pythium oligandrum TaxID=41045 RepID=A0A8K1CDG1_PYTOL|nr:hypothetical protein Poli38472_012580 [Pythium oligandrum]|eukprot:TMW61389.1 hypothetical protein Poli38472_012580 [Pythium oligandrum]
MKPRLPTLAFPSGLKLSPEEQLTVVQEMQAVLAETLHNERIFRNGQASLDKKRWKEVKAKDDFRIYKERNPKSTEATSFSDRDHSVVFSDIMAPRFVSVRDDPAMSTVSSTWTTDSSEVEAGIVHSIKHPRVPMIVAAGNVEGLLEDVVFGSLAGDEASWRYRATYMKDKIADSKILATIQEPTEDDPYRFLCIKWFARECPPFLSPFIQQRDFLVMEATGLTVDEYGVRHGYYIMHEFHHPSLPELRHLKMQRCKISLGYISRQVRPDKVHIFARGFVDPRGDFPHSLSVQLTAEAMTSTANTVETSYMKKLGWLMVQKQNKRRNQQNPHLIPPTVCSCKKTKKASLLTCQVCANSFCSRCTVQRKLVVDMQSDNVVERSMPFCFGCVLKAKKQPPHPVAVDMVVRPRSQLHPST